MALVVLVRCQKKPNNVCPNFRDYFNMANNSNCWYDFAAEMTVVSTTPSQSLYKNCKTCHIAEKF